MSKSSIIVSTDLTDTSNVAIQTGMTWAKKLGQNITLLHIHKKSSLQQTSILFPEYEQKAKFLAQKLHESLIDKLEAQAERINDKDIKVTTSLIYADSLDSYLKIVKEHNAKTLILSAGNSSFDSFIGGSAIEKLIRISPIPVLIAKSDVSVSPRTIAFPFAFQGLSEDAASFSEMIASAFDSSITPIHVHENTELKNQSIDLKNLELLKAKDNIHFGPLLKYLTRMDDANMLKDFKVSYGEGPTKEKLLRLITEISPDLIIMGSSGKKGLERLYLGSFCEFLLRNSNTSLLITKKF